MKEIYIKNYQQWRNLPSVGLGITYDGVQVTHLNVWERQIHTKSIIINHHKTQPMKFHKSVMPKCNASAIPLDRCSKGCKIQGALHTEVQFKAIEPETSR